MDFRRREKKSSDVDAEAPGLSKQDSKFRPRSSEGGFKLSTKLLTILLIYWLVIIHYFERVRVKSAIEKCAWNGWENWKGEQASNRPHRAVLLADPQLVDDHTYPHLPRFANYFIRKMSDNYLHTNYNYMQAYLDPDSTIFVGDLFDGGRDWEDDVWFEEYHRFNKLFPQKTNRKTFRSLPGNHDIGFQNITYLVAKRFAAFFGEPNDLFELGNHTFVQLDTISLSHDDTQISQNAWDFFGSLPGRLREDFPRILLTHVPLYRDPKVEKCGPGRESSKPFPLQKGFQYQTVIDYVYTDKILKTIDPVIVFSGDDHDHCDTVHVDYADNTKKLAREISCKTPSMTNGISYPAYQLLSLNNPDPSKGQYEKTFETVMCYLPVPFRGVKVYALSFLASYFLLIFCIYFPEKAGRFLERRRAILLPQFLKTYTSYEKDSSLTLRAANCGIYCATLTVAVLVLLACYNPM